MHVHKCYGTQFVCVSAVYKAPKRVVLKSNTSPGFILIFQGLVLTEIRETFLFFVQVGHFVVALRPHIISMLVSYSAPNPCVGKDLVTLERFLGHTDT